MKTRMATSVEDKEKNATTSQVNAFLIFQMAEENCLLIRGGEVENRSGGKIENDF